MSTINPSTVAFMDIGTNAIRMMVVRLRPDGRPQILEQRRQAMRLGEDAFVTGQLRPDVMNRAALLCRQWIRTVRATGAGHCMAVATSATRDAKNRRVFLRLLRKRTGLKVRVLSGEDEARLIYLGISRSVNLGARQALFVDIGGGSTELIVGDRNRHHALAMLKLGAIRLSNRYLKPNLEESVSPALYRRIQADVRTRARKVIQQLQGHRMDMAVGSSGTILTLANIAAHRWQKHRLQCPTSLSVVRLRQIIRLLCSLPLVQRRRVPGLQPDRADIIIGGAAILDTLLEELNIQRLIISDRSLRDGLLIEYMEKRKATVRRKHSGLLHKLSPQKRDRPCSVL